MNVAYSFSEQSNNWDVHYQVIPQGEKSESKNFKIQYIGEDENPKEIYYNIKT